MRYQTQRPLTGLQAAGLRSLWAGWLAMACGAFAGSSGKSILSPVQIEFYA